MPEVILHVLVFECLSRAGFILVVFREKVWLAEFEIAIPASWLLLYPKQYIRNQYIRKVLS